MSAHTFDWNLVGYFPIELNLKGQKVEYDFSSGEWKNLSSSNAQPQNTEKELEQLRVKNSILLDMITARELDLTEALKLQQELRDLLNK